VRTQCKRESYSSPGSCQPYKARGEACGDPFDCDLGLSCIAAAGAPAVCSDKLRDGSVCQSNQDCLDTSFCAKGGAAVAGVCTRLKLAGEPCSSVFECSTVSCDQGTCACSTPRVLGFE
jgi:hypothetical protein